MPPGPGRDRGPRPAHPAHRDRHQPGPLGVRQPVGLAEHRDPPGHVGVGEGGIPVARRGQRRPVAQRLDDVDQPGAGPGQVKVDQRVRLRPVRARPEDHVLQVDVAVADQLGRPVHPRGDLAVPLRPRRWLEPHYRLVVPQLQLGQPDQRGLGQGVGGQRAEWHLAGQVGEHLPVLGVNAQDPGSALETDGLKVAEQGVHGRGVRAGRAADGPADPDHAVGQVPAEQGHFQVAGCVTAVRGARGAWSVWSWWGVRFG